MFIFFILFNIFLLHDSEKYVIEDKKDISTKTVFPVKHIYQLASPFHCSVLTLLSLTLLSNTNVTVFNVTNTNVITLLLFNNNVIVNAGAILIQ